MTVALAGLVLRAVALPLPGTLDVSLWKIWAFAASTDRPSRLYGVGGSPPERRALRYRGKQATVDYPPFALDVLAVVGRTYRALRPAFQDGTALTVAVKVPVVIADATLACWLWLFATRHRPSEATRVARAWWLGPAVILNGAVLGYLDPLCALPATGAFLAAADRRWGTAGALGTAALFVKAQGAVPLVALTWWAWQSDRRASLRFLAGTTAVTIAAVAPIVLAGALPNFLVAMVSLTQHDMVSGHAANGWWLYTWVFRAVYDLDVGAWQAFTQPVSILALSTVEDLGHTSPKALATTLAAGAGVWACWRVARRAAAAHGVPSGEAPRAAQPAWALAAALGAFLVHAYFSLAVQVHENHLFLALPLAVVASLDIAAYRRVAQVLGTIQALNLVVFYGLSDVPGWLPPRTLTVVDTSVLLAAAGVAAFVWHVTVFVRATRFTADPDLAAKAARISGSGH